jgi:hypothetical protein
VTAPESCLPLFLLLAVKLFGRRQRAIECLFKLAEVASVQVDANFAALLRQDERAAVVAMHDDCRIRDALFIGGYLVKDRAVIPDWANQAMFLSRANSSSIAGVMSLCECRAWQLTSAVSPMQKTRPHVIHTSA